MGGEGLYGAHYLNRLKNKSQFSQIIYISPSTGRQGQAGASGR